MFCALVCLFSVWYRQQKKKASAHTHVWRNCSSRSTSAWLVSSRSSSWSRSKSPETGDAIKVQVQASNTPSRCRVPAGLDARTSHCSHKQRYRRGISDGNGIYFDTPVGKQYCIHGDLRATTTTSRAANAAKGSQSEGRIRVSSAYVSLNNRLGDVDMTANNLTTGSGNHVPSDVSLQQWPTFGDDTNNTHFQPTGMEAALIVLLACVLASNWQLRRKVANSAGPSARPRGPPKRDFPIENTAVGRSAWNFDWFWVVDLSLRLYSLLPRALLPFDRQVDQDGRLKRHTRYCCTAFALMYHRSWLNAIVHS